jgi:hypothetical protein
MVLDDKLLDKARTAGADMAAVEAKAQLARAEYHTAIRRLHLAGGSLREIAAALSLSHQRVQQIVDQAGGSWWQRVWRTRGGHRDATCTFCGLPPSEVKKLVAGPDVFICDRCLAQAGRALAGRSSALSLAAPRSKTACSFCGKRRDASRSIALAREAAVCGECLELCRQFMA